MAKLNLPGHDSSRVFFFFLLSPVHGENIPCSQQSPELSARVAGTARLEMAPMLWAVWPQSLRTWGRGEQAQALSGAAGTNLLPWKGERRGEACSEQQITQPVGTA